jgi:phosphatidylserine/phosphatidylglycerophosphate/cardiolipin synthase-like enzyme
MRAAAALLSLLLGAPAAAEPRLELVESWPVETTLDHPDLPDAAGVWLQMISGARRSIDLGQFYYAGREGSRLDPILEALEAAAARGVKVRVLADAKFAKIEPCVLARLEANPRLAVRRIDFEKLAGGVMHAKYFIVDGREAFLGSQNFDWRSITHIQELGVRTDVPAIVRALADVFETDWALAGGGDPAARVRSPGAGPFPVAVDGGKVSFAASPRGWLPDEGLWDLPRLLALIDGAKRSVRVEVLGYQATQRGVHWDELESALRRAAARGVPVQLLVADWAKRPGSIEGLKSLGVLPRVEVKLITIPPHSAGFIPYARVVHAKLLVVDGERAWLGTSNWERNYFYDSRNAGLVIEGGPLPARIDRFFATGWSSPYAAPIDACATYQPPRRE